MNLKKIVLFLYLLSCGLFLPAGPLCGEEAKEENQVAELETVTVTANKMEEDVQDVPQSITVMDETVLEEKGITDIPDVIHNIPNMAISQGVHGNAVSFRGLIPSMFTNNNPVVVYIDGVPIINRYGFDASLANVERIEVLRGPQGTLYGKDAIGGVINVVTKAPDNEWQGMTGAEYGSYNYMQGIFNLNGALVDNKFFMGINGKYEKDDGWIENTNPGLDSSGNEWDNQQLSAYLLYTPTDRFTARFALSMDDRSDLWCNGYALPRGSDFSDFNRDDAEEVNYDMPAKVDMDSFSQSLFLSYAFDAMTLTSTTTHRYQDIEGVYDADFMAGTYYDGLGQYNNSESATYTQELRLSGNNTSGVRWVGGVYFDMEKYELGPYGMEYPYYGNYFMNAVSDTDTTTYAAFGQAMIPLGDRFELTLGGRYQHIDKEIDLRVYNLPVGTAGSAFFSYTGDKNWDVFLPKAALKYSLNDNWDTYVSYSEGYMPGGFNTFATSGTADDNCFDSEKSANYEVGIKGTLDRLRISAALFYMDIENIHVYKAYGTGIYYTDNAESAHSQGIELEASYQLTHTIELSCALGFIEAEYDSYDAGYGVSFDGQDIENTPAYTVNAGISYAHPFGIYARVDMRAAGKTSFYDDANKQFVQEDEYVAFDAKIGYQTGRWNFYVYGKNLTDEAYIENFISGSAMSMADFGDPLTIGAGVRYRF